MHMTPGQLVQDMYAQAPYEEYKRAYKNPLDLFYPSTSLRFMDTYFPETKLLITLRHPVYYVSDKSCVEGISALPWFPIIV